MLGTEILFSFNCRNDSFNSRTDQPHKSVQSQRELQDEQRQIRPSEEQQRRRRRPRRRRHAAATAAAAAHASAGKLAPGAPSKSNSYLYASPYYNNNNNALSLFFLFFLSSSSSSSSLFFFFVVVPGGRMGSAAMHMPLLLNAPTRPSSPSSSPSSQSSSLYHAVQRHPIQGDIAAASAGLIPTPGRTNGDSDASTRQKHSFQILRRNNGLETERTKDRI